MKKILGVICFFYLSFFLAFTQEIIDPVIEEEPVAESSSFLDFLNQSFSGTIGLASGFGAYGERNNYFFRLQYNQEFTDWLKVVLTGNAYFNSVKLNLILKSECQGTSTKAPAQCNLKAGDNPPPAERSITQEETKTELREAYFDLSLGDFALLSAGRKLLGWGQFEIFSPIDLTALPTRFGSLGLTFSKLDARLTQDVVQLNLYPFEGAEFQTFYIPTQSVDPFLANLIQKEGGRNYLKYLTATQPQDVTYDLTNPQDPSQVAARLLFYPSWGILGFTYHQGFANFPETLAFINNSVPTRPFIEEKQEYPARDVVGFELSIPVGRWGWKFEIAYTLNAVDTIKLKTFDLDEFRFVAIDTPNSPVVEAGTKLVDWIMTENNNKLYYEYQNVLSAFGLDVELDLWKFNLVIFYFDNFYNTKVQKGRALEIMLQNARNQQGSTIMKGAFPSFNIVKYWNENKETKLGWIAGVIPGGVGTSFYFNQDYYESLTIVAALEAIQYFGDGSLLSGIIGQQYEPIEPLSTGLRVGALYAF